MNRKELTDGLNRLRVLQVYNACTVGRLHMAVPGSHRTVRFGLFELDFGAGELRKRGEKIKLQEQPFRVLGVVVERAGDVVTREELKQALWPSNTFVEFDQGLNTAIKKIRRALGDSADNPRFIETVPRQGYRFIAPLEAAGARPVQDAAVRHLHSNAVLWTCVAVALLLAASGVFALRRSSHSATVAATGFRAVPLTTYPGVECTPTFSPDGAQVAFSWNGEDQKKSHIYVKTVGAETPLQLTHGPADDINPAWSPDGRRIAFMRHPSDAGPAVFLIPPTGGPPQKLTEVAADFLIGQTELSWFPDSNWLVVADRVPSVAAPSALFAVSISTGEKRRLTTPQAGLLGDNHPAVSPDGRTVAFCRYANFNTSDLYILRLSPQVAVIGEPTRLTHGDRAVSSPAWTAGGHDIVYVFGHLGPLYRVSVSGPAKPTPLPGVSNGTGAPAISRKGNRLAYVVVNSADVNIWRIRSSPTVSGPAKLIASTAVEHQPQYSPDGNRIAFASTRSGNAEIWVCDRNGHNPVRLTTFGVADRGTEWPSWSPDGRQIIFTSKVDGRAQVFLVSADGGAPTRVKTDFDASASTWSHDGRWIYFESTRTGERQVWRMSADGNNAIQITDNGGNRPIPSRDGRYIYYAKGAEIGSVWRLPTPEQNAADNRETLVIAAVENLNFAVMDDGVYFIAPESPAGHRLTTHVALGDKSSIAYYELSTRRTRKLVILDGLLQYGFSVSPDSRSILYTHTDSLGADLRIVDNFR